MISQTEEDREGKDSAGCSTMQRKVHCSSSQMSIILEVIGGSEA
jgi:hypothetical protein